MVYLLDLEFGPLFNLIVEALTETTFSKQSVINSEQPYTGYIQLYRSSETRGWKYLSPLMYKFLIFLSAAFIFANFFVKNIVMTLLSERLAKRADKYTKQLRGKLIGAYVTANEINYMNVVPLVAYFLYTATSHKTLLGFVERLAGVLLVLIGAIYSKIQKYESLRRFKETSHTYGQIPVKRSFRTKAYCLSIHILIEEQIQAATALTLFVFQQHKSPVVIVLIISSIGQIFLCYIFLGKYRWFISLAKIVCYLAMLSFFIGASLMLKGLPPDSTFFSWMIGLIIAFKILEVILSLADSTYRWKQHCTLNKVKPIKTSLDRPSLLVAQTSDEKFLSASVRFDDFN